MNVDSSGVSSAERDATMTAPAYALRLALPEDVALLPDVERRAGLLFKTYAGDLGITDQMYDDPTPVETFAQAQRAGRLWVATASDGTLVGFVLGERHRLCGGHAQNFPGRAVERAVLRAPRLPRRRQRRVVAGAPDARGIGTRRRVADRHSGHDGVCHDGVAAGQHHACGPMTATAPRSGLLSDVAAAARRGASIRGAVDGA
jgi:hypothetical protein